MTEALEPGELRVCYAFSSELTEAQRLRCRGVLSDDEIERHARFRFEEDRDAYLVAHALTRTMLASALDVPGRELRFEPGANGRPELAWPERAPRLRFNLSHTRGLVACGLALELDIGVDVEHEDRRVEIDSLSKRVFSTTERQGLDALQGDAQRRRFFEVWTLKEAYLKATGVGLTRSLQAISITLAEGRPPSIAFASPNGDSGTRWLMRVQTVRPRFVLAVAAATSGTNTRCSVAERSPWS
ncbi:MAG: 4'-phosphopantetheinyl transferase family protein [Polyangiales bacterium]